MTEIQNIDENKPKTKYLKDYKSPAYSIETVDLTFELEDEQTLVTNQMSIKSLDSSQPLKLNGERLKLISVEVDGRLLSPKEYELCDHYLTLSNLPQEFQLTIKSETNPLANTFLDGLYKSKGLFCTQNEPEGFRKITYFLDRPDVMSSYTTKIIANKQQNPILLSNGNKIDSGDLDNGRHFVTWKDPFKKPCYLFALIAGDLGCLHDQYVTKSGKTVKLEIYSEKGSEDKCLFAMESLKKSMQWDEQVFDLEYDLDIFMIAAVEAFNAGAMENKGLNIFNISCVLADQKSSTDDNFIRVEKVIAHEYFHNWTGDRVTVRDWFQLTLKEGLTVFRDQEFTSDLHSRPVHRIENVSLLRNHQFAEDAGPTSHPIRPSSYIEMNNFYTSTVYDKGSEIIRMVHTLLGKENFFKGMKKYFELYDGKAVTCDDFINAMEQASQKDLSQFKRWYSQKGTPKLKVSFQYNPQEKTFTLDVEQSNPKEGNNAAPLHFPLKIGLISPDGKELEVNSVLEVKEKKQSFHFQDIEAKPYVSLNRDFSAPVSIESPLSQSDLIFLMHHDQNDFNRWESAQEIAMQMMLQPNLNVPSEYFDALKSILLDAKLENAFKALALGLPSESLIGQKQAIIQFNDNHSAREQLLHKIAENLETHFLQAYQQLEGFKDYKVEARDMGKRQLKNTCLSYLCQLNKPEYYELAYKQFQSANNMTDSFGALAILNKVNCPQREQALQTFYDQWHQDVLVFTKWLSLQAISPLEGALDRVKQALQSPSFDYKIPNLVRAVMGSFFENHIHFHDLSGSGYAFAADQISIIDEINPSVAARLSSAFKKFPKLDKERQKMLKASLETLLSKKNLSRNAYEMISKSLKTT